MSDETWAQVRKHFDEDQAAALVCLVAMINAANRMGVIVRQKGGSYQVGLLASFKVTGRAARAAWRGLACGRLGGMGDAGFDPLNLDADATLNQVVIGAAGGPGVAGLRAGLACSRDALLALAAGHGLAGLRRTGWPTGSRPRPRTRPPRRAGPRPPRWRSSAAAWAR